tara:strand:+ start:853 stop:1602 length:750 start_codon:yes stop_codon:yes gene_type:complete
LLQVIFAFFGRRYFFIFFKIFFKGLVKIMDIKVKFLGIPEKKNVLYVSNHISYIDIFILGSCLEGFFVAKSEISEWPLINKLCNLGGTIFIDRENRFSVKRQAELINSNICSGNNIILFPEGTSSDGKQVLPFKSSLFSVLELNNNKNCLLQSISITYSKLDNLPIDTNFLPFLAWFGKMDFITHIWKFLGLGNSEVIVNFNKGKKFSVFKDRKEAAKLCFDLISKQASDNKKSVEVENQIKLYEFKYL